MKMEVIFKNSSLNTQQTNKPKTNKIKLLQTCQVVRTKKLKLFIDLLN